MWVIRRKVLQYQNKNITIYRPVTVLFSICDIGFKMKYSDYFSGL